MANIKINGRLSFPSLFKKATFEGKEGKFEATIMFPKSDTKTYEACIAGIEAMKKENKGAKVPDSKTFIKDGDDVEYDGCEGMWMVKASNNKRPTTLKRDGEPAVEEDDVFYAGCYVQAIIEPWFQNNQFGKRVNANLLGVKFAKDGEPLGDGGTTVGEDDFDEFDDDL